MKTLTIKLEPHQNAWLEQQARALKRSKGSLVRDLIEAQRGRGKNDTVGHALRDLCGVFKGPRDLSTRPLKGYGRHQGIVRHGAAGRFLDPIRSIPRLGARAV